MAIATKLTDLITDLHECRKAITYRGGEISATAGFEEVAEKITSLPASTSIGTVVDEETSSFKMVPANSTKYCYLRSLGGMTYKSTNLLPFPYYDGKDVGYTQTINGITYTINEDRSITINGTSNGGSSFLLANYLNLPSDSYTISIVHVSGDWTGNQSNSPYISGTGLSSTNYPISTRPTVTISTNPVWLSINVPNGAIVNNVVLKPMLNRGSTALPYEDYYEGLKDTKPTTIKSYRANGDLIKEYPIPEALQGTGKGINNTYHDAIDFESGNKQIKLGTVVYDGTEAWVLNSTESYHGFYTLDKRPSSMRNSYGICSHYEVSRVQFPPVPSITIANPTFSNNLIWCRTYDATGENGFTSVTEWTDFLKEQVNLGNPLTIDYVLAEPTETDIDTSAFDPLIEVEGGGSIEFITDNGKASSSTIIYQTIL